MILRHTRSTLFPYTTLFRSESRNLFGFAGTDEVTRIRRFTPTDERLEDFGTCRFRQFDKFGDGFLRADLTQIQMDHNSLDRKSTRLNSSHVRISYAVFCLKK